jgi:hypothetical protein
LLLLLGLLLGCAPAASVGGTGPAAPGPLRLASVPDQVGAFRRTETITYPRADAGTLYRFRGGGSLDPDVYVYPVAPETRGKGPGPREWAASQGPLFQLILEAQKQQGRLESVRMVADSAFRLTVRSALVDGWHTSARVTLQGQERDTHQLLFGVGDDFVKVRTSFAPGSVTDAELRQFAQALLEQLVAR